MIDSKLYTYKYINGEIQKVQVVTCTSFDELNFVKTNFNKQALKNVAYLYQNYFIKRFPFIYGRLHFYHIPDDYVLPFKIDGIANKNIASKIYLSTHPKNKISKNLISDLKIKGYLTQANGWLNKDSFMPFDKCFGFLSDIENYSFKINCNFFSFNLQDCQSDYDIFGTNIGLIVKNNKVLNIPLFNREALFIYKDGTSEIKKIDITDLSSNISGTVYTRPRYRFAPKCGYNVVIINDEIIAVEHNQKTKIPSTGYIVNTNKLTVKVGDKIKYDDLKDVKFAIQVGNSAVINSKITNHFISKFHNIKKLETTVIPPFFYPLNFNKDRAPRVVLGVNSNGQPVFFLFEGKNKYSYKIGEDSCGASLKECGDILKNFDIINAIHLDGGGSAQLQINSNKLLKISDRNKDTNQELERGIPLSICIK